MQTSHVGDTSPLPPLTLEVGPLIAARGSGGVLKLPQRVRAEPGRQTLFGAFWAKNASGTSNFKYIFTKIHQQI